MPSGSPNPTMLVKPTPMTIAVIMVNTDWAKAHPQLIQNYYTAYLRGVRDYCEAYHGAPNRNEIIDLLIRHGSEPRPEMCTNIRGRRAAPMAASTPRACSTCRTGSSRTAMGGRNSRPHAWSMGAMRRGGAKLGPFARQSGVKLEGCR